MHVFKSAGIDIALSIDDTSTDPNNGLSICIANQQFSIQLYRPIVVAVTQRRIENRLPSGLSRGTNRLYPALSHIETRVYLALGDLLGQMRNTSSIRTDRQRRVDVLLSVAERRAPVLASQYASLEYPLPHRGCTLHRFWWSQKKNG